MNQQPWRSDPRLLTRKQVAEMLNVGLGAIRTLEKQGSLPRVQIGDHPVSRYWRYLKEDVDKLIPQLQPRSLYNDKIPVTQEERAAQERNQRAARQKDSR